MLFVGNFKKHESIQAILFIKKTIPLALHFIEN